MMHVLLHTWCREGLPVALMEAKASGLPVLCSRIRGTADLIDESGGRLCGRHSMDECVSALHNLQQEEMKALGQCNFCEDTKFFDEQCD